MTLAIACDHKRKNIQSSAAELTTVQLPNSQQTNNSVSEQACVVRELTIRSENQWFGQSMGLCGYQTNNSVAEQSCAVSKQAVQLSNKPVQPGTSGLIAEQACVIIQ